MSIPELMPVDTCGCYLKAVVIVALLGWWTAGWMILLAADWASECIYERSEKERYRDMWDRAVGVGFDLCKCGHSSGKHDFYQYDNQGVCLYADCKCDEFRKAQP